jgi:hypothetical protein
MAVSFYNDNSFIRVENATTGVTSYFSKANLTLQCDQETSFFLKSDSYQQYYMYEDVARPESQDVKKLLEIFQTWIEDTAKDNREGSIMVSDTTSTVLEVKNFYDKDPLRVDEILKGDAPATTFDAGKNAIRMDVTATPASGVVRQTKLYAPILNNKHMFSVVGATLINDTTMRNVCSRVGVFDDNEDITAPGSVASGNGIFFQFDSVDGLSLKLRSNISGAQALIEDVPQAQWNIDTFDGQGPSAIVLNPTEEQTYIFEWSALKGNTIRAGILHDGLAYFCHKFSNVRMGCASLPLRWQIFHPSATAPTDEAHMIQGASSVLIEGANDMPRVSRAYSNSVSNIKSVTHANSPMPIMSIKLKPSSNRASLYPKRVRIMNLDPGIAKWSLVLNAPTLTGYSFADVGNGSYVQVSESESAISGGVTLATGFFTESGAQTIELDDKFLPLCANIAGSTDVLTLVVSYLRGVVSVSAALEWVELE